MEKWSSRWASSLVFAGFLLAGCTGGSSDGETPPDFVGAVAEEYGLSPDGLTVENSAEASFPLTDRVLQTAKVYDLASDQVYTIAFDEDGNVVDESEFVAAETAARDGKYGNIDERLFERLQVLADDESVPVSIWAKEEPSREVAQEILVEWLEAGGYEATHVDELAPFVGATLPKQAILELAEHPTVFRIFLDEETGGDG